MSVRQLLLLYLCAVFVVSRNPFRRVENVLVTPQDCGFLRQNEMILRKEEDAALSKERKEVTYCDVLSCVRTKEKNVFLLEERIKKARSQRMRKLQKRSCLGGGKGKVNAQQRERVVVATRESVTNATTGLNTPIPATAQYLFPVWGVALIMCGALFLAFIVVLCAWFVYHEQRKRETMDQIYVY